MFYIVQDGMVWELTRTKYKQLLRQLALGNDFSMSNYGKQVGRTSDALDLSAVEAGERLKHMGG